MTHLPYSMRDSRPAFSVPSIVAAAAAVGSFFVGAGFALLLAVVAIICGIIGVMLALSPRVRGGMISVLSIVLGGLGVIAAILRIIF